MNPEDQNQGDSQNIAVEYTHDVLEDIGTYVTENFERRPGDSVESGGVLFGTHSRRIVTVTAMRPVPCSYSSGPVFVLSPGDLGEFEATARLHLSDSSLEGLEPVGWFLSHVRDSLVLRPADREIYDRYFAQPWQMVLVMRPGRVGLLRAATIGRTPETRAETVLNEFTIKHVPGPGEASPEERPETPVSNSVPVKVISSQSAAEPVRTSVHPEPALATRSAGALVRRESPSSLLPSQGPGAVRSARSRWAGVAIAAVVACLVVLAATVFMSVSASDNVGLRAFERDGILHIEWNPDARSVSRATRATLQVGEGTSAIVKNLSKEDLKRGFFPALRKQADVNARLALYDSAGKVKQEQTRYIGRPIPEQKPNPPPPDPFKAENSALQEELSRERERADQLERRVKVLQTIIQRRDGR